MIDELTRRGFLKLSGASLAAAGGDDLPQLQADVRDDTVSDYGLLVGPASARPAAAQLREEWDTFNYVYFATDTGAKSHIRHDLDGWQDMATETTVPTTQVEEARVEDFTPFFDHTFARPEAPDTKNWEFTDADVTKVNSEIELAASTSLTSTQQGNYPPGTEVIPGFAMRLTGAPTSGSGEAGYTDGTDGFGVGEDATDSYVFMRKAGSDTVVYRDDWNGYSPDGRVWVSDSPVVTRFPHLFYGGGKVRVRALLHDGPETRLRTLHTFTPDNTPGTGPPWDQPNLPIDFTTDGLSGGALRANAAHYEFGETKSETRVNGEQFTEVNVSDTGWTPLIAWRKRSGWDMVNVKPLKIGVTAAGADLKLGLQLDPSVSGGTWDLPENTSSSETAVEVNTGVTLDATGERRWPGYVAAGQGNKAAQIKDADVTFNLPSGRVVALVAQAVGKSATASGVVAWDEFF